MAELVAWGWKVLGGLAAGVAVVVVLALVGVVLGVVRAEARRLVAMGRRWYG